MAVAAEFPCLRRIREILRKQENSTATAKIRGSARNSAGRGKTVGPTHHHHHHHEETYSTPITENKT